jgi:ubiquinone/menaquinone biosynthesis C-methylase UbiE
MTNTSWQHVSKWYGKSVASKDSYHENLVIPKTLKLLSLTPDSKLLDLACGNGILARHIPKTNTYFGFDAAASLIKDAQASDKNPLHRYATADVTKPLSIIDTNFSHAAIILALQNISDGLKVLQNVQKHLRPHGKLLIVLNHPCFRIPRQSSWGIDETNKIEYRRINRYLSPLKIPITTHPGAAASRVPNGSPITWSFHEPLSSYSEMLFKSGFVIEKLEEWTSHKESVGSAARMENRARDEFPLFLALLCRRMS